MLRRRWTTVITACATYILAQLKDPAKEEEEEAQVKTLKDLNFETATASDLGVFFQDKSFNKDVLTMLRLYLDITISSLGVQLDDLIDEMARIKAAKLNTAFHVSRMHDVAAKKTMLASVRHMLLYDAWSMGLPRSSPFRMWLVNVADCSSFRNIIFVMILCNLVLLAADSPPRVGREREVLDLVQLPIYSSFVFEMLVLLVGQGVRTYWRDPWNRLDFLIVVGSMIDMATYYTIEQDSDSLSIVILLTGLRTLRALRPLRMLRRAKTLRRLGLTIVAALSSLSAALALFAAFIYVAAVLMLQFLSGKLSHCTDRGVHLQVDCFGLDESNAERKWVPSEFNAEWIGAALLTALAVASGNGWGAAMSRSVNAARELGQGPVMRASPEMFTIHLLVVLIGRFLFANLFLGVLAQAYSQVNREGKHKSILKRAHLRRLTQLAHLHHFTATLLQQQAVTSEKGGRQPSRSRTQVPKQLLKASKQQNKPSVDAPLQGAHADDVEVMDEHVARKLTRKDLPLLYIEPKSEFRRFFFRALSSKELETLVLVSILLNASCSALNTLKASHQQQQLAAHAEFVLSSIFSLELLIRLLAYHPRAFLQSSWNVLDLVLVMTSFIAVCLEASPPQMQPMELPISPQLLRTARTFRAARLIKFAPAVLGALSTALPKMMTLFMLCLIVLFGCASMGVSMLSNICLLGEMAEGDNQLRCQLVNDEGKLPQHSNFRNSLMSLLTLVRFSTGEGWVDIMQRSSLVSHDFPRKKDAVQMAARALSFYHNASAPWELRQAGLTEARLHLPGCIRGVEMRQLQELRVIDCR